MLCSTYGVREVGAAVARQSKYSVVYYPELE